MTAELLAFAIAGGISVIAAANAVLRRDPLTSALSLTVTLLGLAVLYLSLGAPFLFGVQIAVYGGAIMVLLVFVIMLLGAGRAAVPQVAGRPRLAVAGPLVTISLFALLATAILRGRVFFFFEPVAPLQPAVDPVAALADVLFRRYLFAFEVTSVLLLAALIGAVVVARKRSTEREWGGRR